ncbi:MAG: hypothetical protein ACRC28_10240 [Clostridium sp.]|uniref:hypothetical protein n=1 Tax=Clostridium sp. TaxID=1506 RepID=UPI003F350DF3
MPLQISIKPNIANNGSGMKTTTLEIEIDVEEYLEVLKENDLLLKMELIVKGINIVTKEEEENIYEFAKIYKNITTTSIIISTIVWGKIEDTNNIKCAAIGVFVKK